MSLWYNDSKKYVFSTRKHTLRLDLRVYPIDGFNPASVSNNDSQIKSLLTSAIIRGLDVLGVVSKETIYVGIRAQEISKSLGLDLYILPGLDITTNDKYNLIAYNITNNNIPKDTYENAAKAIKKQNGIILLYNLSKRHAMQINKLKNTVIAPDFIEVFNLNSGGFFDIKTDYPHIVNSCATSGNELEDSGIYTAISRINAEKLRLIPENFGVDFEPNYLSKGINNGQPIL